MLLTAYSGNNGNTGTAKKPNNSPSTGLINNSTPDSVTEIGYDAFVHCESINATYKGTSYDYQHIEDLYKAING